MTDRDYFSPEEIVENEPGLTGWIVAGVQSNGYVTFRSSPRAECFFVVLRMFRRSDGELVTQFGVDGHLLEGLIRHKCIAS